MIHLTTSQAFEAPFSEFGEKAFAEILIMIIHTVICEDCNGTWTLTYLLTAGGASTRTVSCDHPAGTITTCNVLVTGPKWPLNSKVINLTNQKVG